MDVLVDFAYKEKELEDLPIADIALFVLNHEGQPDDTEVSVSFVDDETIARLNEEYRGKQGPTDVLSFECDGADDPDGAFEALQAEEPLYELGDVVIAVDVAQRQCKTYGTTFAEEITILLIHGLLHLCGYDHVTDEDAAIMEPLEAQVKREWEAAHEA